MNVIWRLSLNVALVVDFHFFVMLVGGGGLALRGCWYSLGLPETCSFDGCTGESGEMVRSSGSEG